MNLSAFRLVAALTFSSTACAAQFFSDTVPLADIRADDATVQAWTAQAKAALANAARQPAVNEPIGKQALGSANSDLVYTPLSKPCHALDTRLIGGGSGTPLAVGVSRSFDIDDGNFTAQGGNASGCSMPSSVAQAVVMGFTPVFPSNIGWLLGAPANAAFDPNAVLMTYSTGSLQTTTVVVPVLPGLGFDFNLMAQNTGTHLVGDIIGYFAPNQATALQCQRIDGPVTLIAPNPTNGIASATCPAGFTVTGGGWGMIEGAGGTSGVNIWYSLASGNSWSVTVANLSGGNRNVQAFATCCRVPGR